MVGLGSSLVLNPSRESYPIAATSITQAVSRVELAGLPSHGAGWKRFLELQCTSLTRAEKEVDLPARIDVHEYVRAHFGPGSERHTEKPRE